VTTLFTIRNNKASVIADSIKDVYRDLLSANDKALESFNQSKNQNRGGRAIIYDFGEHEDNGKLNQGRFKGYLSMGVDDSTNTLLISCPQSLMDNISQIIQRLDKAAIPAQQAVQVLQIDRSIDPASLQKKLSELLKPGGAKPETPGQQPGAEKGPGQRRGGRGGQNRSGGQEAPEGGGGGGE
jgi:type II secretory pathway component GspD/PulD (secretin)